MTESSKKFDTPEELIAHIQESCKEGGPYVFRGTRKVFDEISSSIYRDARRGTFNEDFLPVDVEEDIVDRARRYFSPNTSNAEILTDLRHFHGDTTLIDFSRNLLVALYFTCDGEPDEDGELIAYPLENRPERHNIDYEEPRQIVFLHPVRTQFNRARVDYQSSIFVHVPEGVIPKSDCELFTVPKELKGKMRDHLRDFHNITEVTIYNDLIGFIQNQKNFKEAESLFYQGLAAAQRENYEEASAKYDEAIRLKPDLSEVYNNRGNAKAGLGHHEKALSDHDEAIRLKPDSAEAYYNRGGVKADLSRYEEALVDYGDALRLKSDFAEAYSNRGYVKDELGRYEEALADYDEAIRLKADYAGAYNNRGSAKVGLGRHGEALADYDEAIRLKSNFAEAYNNRGNLKDDLGCYEEALTDYNEATRLKPDFAVAYHNWGYVKAGHGHHEEALAGYDEAIRLKPDYAEAYFNRGVTNRSLGRIEEARKDFGNARNLAHEQGHQAFATETQRRLSELGD